MLLIIPLEETYREFSPELEKVAKDILTGAYPVDWSISELIISQVRYLNKQVKEVYDKNEETN